MRGRLCGAMSILMAVACALASPIEAKFVVQGHVYDDVADPFQREIFDPEICLLQSAAVWYLLAIRFEARLGEYLLQCCEHVLVFACRGACMLRAGF